MGHASGVRYSIDENDVLVSVDEEWDVFAAANDGRDAVAAKVVGRVLWGFLADDSTIQIYKDIVARVRAGRRARFTLRCDGPTRRRVLEMSITSPDGRAVDFETTVLRIEERAPVTLLARHAPRTDALILVCAWCKRFSVGVGEWAEVEDAVARLRTFESPPVPRMTHGMCEPCLAAMKGTVAALSAG